MCMQQVPQVARERHRRSSIAGMLSGDSGEYSPEWAEDPENLDPINLPEGTGYMLAMCASKPSQWYRLTGAHG
jgi:hypothetical protein